MCSPANYDLLHASLSSNSPIANLSKHFSGSAEQSANEASTGRENIGDSSILATRKRETREPGVSDILPQEQAKEKISFNRSHADHRPPRFHSFSAEVGTEVQSNRCITSTKDKDEVENAILSSFSLNMNSIAGACPSKSDNHTYRRFTRNTNLGPPLRVKPESTHSQFSESSDGLGLSSSEHKSKKEVHFSLDSMKETENKMDVDSSSPPAESSNVISSYTSPVSNSCPVTPALPNFECKVFNETLKKTNLSFHFEPSAAGSNISFVTQVPDEQNNKNDQASFQSNVPISPNKLTTSSRFALTQNSPVVSFNDSAISHKGNYSQYINTITNPSEILAMANSNTGPRRNEYNSSESHSIKSEFHSVKADSGSFSSAKNSLHYANMATACKAPLHMGTKINIVDSAAPRPTDRYRQHDMSAFDYSSNTKRIVENSMDISRSSYRREIDESFYNHSSLHPAFSSILGADKVTSVNGQYYISLGKIGRGGSSEVFRVLSSDGRILALKKVEISNSDTSSFESYSNEIALLKTLRGNPSIIELVDAEISPERSSIALILELGETDLSQLLQRQKERNGTSPHFTRLIWLQMLEAVKALHSHRVVHGDLKPANFVLCRGVLKLIDFGIAKAIGCDTSNIHRDSHVGTVNYMSPEALSDTGMGELDPSTGKKTALMKLGRPSDVWSLGCILYQLVYGRTPFSEINSLVLKFQAILSKRVRITFDKVDDPYLMDTMKKCLQRNPEHRAPIDGENGLLNHPYLSNAQRIPLSALRRIVQDTLDVLRSNEGCSIDELTDKVVKRAQGTKSR